MSCSGNFGAPPNPPHLTSNIERISLRASYAVKRPILPPGLCFFPASMSKRSFTIPARMSAALSTSSLCMCHSHFTRGNMSVIPGICPVVRLGNHVVQKNGRPSGVRNIFSGHPALPFWMRQISMNMLSMSGRSSRSTFTGMQAEFIIPATSMSVKQSLSITWHQ